MTFKHAPALVAGLASVLGLTATAEAAPISYNFTSGTATLTLTAGSSSLLQPGSSVGLTSGQVTFDATALQVNSFQFQDAGPSNANGAGPLLGTTLTVSNLNIVPGAGYSTLAASGTNPYNYTVGPVAVSGTYSLSGVINQPATPFASVNPFLSGQITLGGVTTLTLTGITLGSFTLPPALGGQTATLKADIVFNGIVPVPAALPLFGSALGLVGLPLMRRRSKI
jgi:hypothetical protein